MVVFNKGGGNYLGAIILSFLVTPFFFELNIVSPMKCTPLTSQRISFEKNQKVSFGKNSLLRSVPCQPTTVKDFFGKNLSTECTHQSRTSFDPRIQCTTFGKKSKILTKKNLKFGVHKSQGFFFWGGGGNPRKNV